MVPKEMIEMGKTSIGIEFGSTNIKAVLVGENHEVLSSGSHRWESSYENGYFTYSMEKVLSGLRSAYSEMKKDTQKQYGIVLKKTGCIGISAMMHGYLAFDAQDRLLVPFRTWQNSTTAKAAQELSGLFSFNIPERWSIAHLYQAMLDREEHVPSVAWITTLAGYVHYLLTGQHVIGIGDASGMFPIDSEKLCYDERMLDLFRGKAGEYDLQEDILQILPKILLAGEPAGSLTPEGAALLDEEGDLKAGVLFCPPEGDAGTGMTATNSVRENTGNVSAGTSIFSMVVLDKPMKGYYREIDMVTTPSGKPVAMVHCNNCTNDMNAWAGMLQTFIGQAAVKEGECAKEPDPGTVYRVIYELAQKGDPDCGGTVVCNYIAGEPVTGMMNGCPMVYRDPGREFRAENFCRAILYSSIISLKIGMGVLNQEEIRIDRLIGHGGLFKNGTVASGFLASALQTKVCIMKTAEVGGPYGMALLAQYCCEHGQDESLEDWLDSRVFLNTDITVSEPSGADAQGIQVYEKNFRELISKMKG